MIQPIYTALCSFGMSGHLFHAPFIDANPKFSLYGVMERSRNLAQGKYPNIKTFRDLDTLLADPKIELVILNTPNITHFDFAKQIIKSGKHEVVEKPFTATVSEAEELIELAKQKNVHLSVYQNRRYDSDFKTVKKILQQGVLGDIVDVELHYDRFEPNLSYKKHKEASTKAVGSLYDLGSHIIDQALELFGLPKSIFAYIDSFRKNSQVADYFDVKLFYDHHVVSLKSSYFVRESLPAYILHGTKGSFIKTKSDIQEAELQNERSPDSDNWGVEPDGEKGLLHILKDGKFQKEYITSERGNYMEYYDRIYESIRNNKALPVTPHEAMQVVQIIEAAIKSDTDKRIIEL